MRCISSTNYNNDVFALTRIAKEPLARSSYIYILLSWFEGFESVESGIFVLVLFTYFQYFVILVHNITMFKH
jgi:hypothetical protein